MKTPLPFIQASTLAAVIVLAVGAVAGTTVNEVWTRRYNGPANKFDYPWSLAIDPAGDVLITGRSWNEDGSSDVYTAKYAGVDGALRWERRHDRQAEDTNGQKVMAFDPSGNVIVAGYSNNGSSTNCRISKFAGADGSVLWERFLNAGTMDRGQTPVAVHSDGSIVVACRPGEGQRFHISKLAAADGSSLWQTPVDDSSGGTFYVGNLTLDANGDAIVCGSRQSDLGLETIYTAKYAGATGAMVWENGFNPPGDYSWPTAMVVDGMGDVVVVGITLAMSGYHKGLIFKLASADGVAVWQTSLPTDPATELTTSYDPADVAVDSAGNAFVTSSMSIENPPGDPVHTAKFAAADGTLKWERKHTRQHAEELIDMAGGIALDSFGNVVRWGWLFAAVYSAVDGAMLWESPPFVRESTPIVYSGSHLATGPHGMIAILGQVNNNADFETSVFRSAPFPPSFAGWVAGFGLAGVSPASDPDADGVPSAVEYVLGGHPSSAARFGHPLTVVTPQPLILRFLRDDASETRDVTLTVQAGTTLASWPESFVVGPDTASSSPGVSIAENGSDPDTVTITFPPGEAAPQFARLAVTIAP